MEEIFRPKPKKLSCEESGLGRAAGSTGRSGEEAELGGNPENEIGSTGGRSEARSFRASGDCFGREIRRKTQVRSAIL